MNTTAAFEKGNYLSQLHGNNPVMPDLYPESHDPRTRFPGRITSVRPAPRGPAQHRPGFNPAPAQASDVMTDTVAKGLIVAGLQLAVQHISTLPEGGREAELKALVAGTSKTGFVTTSRDGQKVTTLEGLRSLVFATHRLTTAKLFDRGDKHLFFFSMPRGWSAYAGEVKYDSVLRYYAKKDREAKKLWLERSTASGYVHPEGFPPGYVEETDPFTGVVAGPYVRMFQKGTYVRSVLLEVSTPRGPRQEWRPRLVNINAPLHRARTLTFVVDKASGRLLAWQPGRYVADMSPTAISDRVILASGDTSDDEL